jgi:hypothetical protein
MRFVSGLGLTAVACMALLGCTKKTLDEVISEHKTALEAKFQEIHQLEPTVAAADRNASDTLASPPPAIVLEPESKANAAVIHVEDLKDPAAQASVALRTLRTKQLGECGSILRKKKYLTTLSDPIPKVAASYFEQCEAVRYLFVLRTFEHEAPQALDDKSFTPGRFEGDILVYELATKKSLGGFKISVKSSATVTVVGDQTSDRLGGDFEANVFVAIDDAIRARIPGALPPSR